MQDLFTFALAQSVIHAESLGVHPVFARALAPFVPLPRPFPTHAFAFDFEPDDERLWRVEGFICPGCEAVIAADPADSYPAEGETVVIERVTSSTPGRTWDVPAEEWEPFAEQLERLAPERIVHSEPSR